ncbi:hypothetical protein [Parasitella parasitica]|uniref:HMG box domain-containing protein n=1 Tax=Parasitella parasitica TaxID=35722 RepID=A0A0B7NEV7_9FUNG|nr:hypothetical protein [Parasitella parasitica]
MPSSLTSTSSSTTTFSSSSAGIPMSITNATKASYLSPKEDYLTDQHPVFSSTYSPVELAPLLNISDNRPPSPDSPKLRKFTLSNLSYYDQQHCPPFLEPTPQLKIHDTGFFPLDLFKVFKTKIPTLRRSTSIQSLPSSRYSTASPPVSSTTTTSTASTKTVNDSAMSPIMAAASASAAAAANDRHPGSHVAKSLLESIGTSANYIDQQAAFSSTSTKSLNKKQAAIAAAAAANVDQSMFLTKNAHIKRPRNAWIHFRCHYGQALKSQDPTLRAEEISKRASRRWGKLSENEKRPWHGLAEQEKLAHREAFPEYRYCPRRANSSSSATAPPSPPHNLTINRPRSASQLNTPLNMHDFNHSSSSSRAPKRMKRMK